MIVNATMSNLKPPFTLETAREKVKVAQRLWNTRDPHKVCLAYTVSHALGPTSTWDSFVFAKPDTIWRNRDQFMTGREEVIQFLSKKWERENGYRLRKELFAFTENKIAVQVS